MELLLPNVLLWVLLEVFLELLGVALPPNATPSRPSALGASVEGNCCLVRGLRGLDLQGLQRALVGEVRRDVPELRVIAIVDVHDDLLFS